MANQSAGSTWHIISSYLFIPSLNGSNMLIPVLAPGWTLNYEMMFYLLFALALFWRFYPLTFLLPTLGLIAATGWFPHPSWPSFLGLVSPLVLEFLYGVLLAHFTLQRRLPNPLLSIVLLAGGFAIILMNRHPIPDARPFYVGLPAAAIVTGMVALEDQIGKRLPNWLLEAGNASYSTYLVHEFVLPVVWVVLAHLHQKGPLLLTELVLLAIAASFISGEVVHRLIELPLTKWFRVTRVRRVREPLI